MDKLAFEAVTTSNVTTYTTDVVPIKTPDFMRSGMTANVTFYADTRENVLLVPTESIRSEGGKTFVMVKNPDPKGEAINKPIKIGITDGKKTEVLEGVTEGEVLLISDVSLEDPAKAANPFMPSRPRGAGGGGRR
ncbi:MAG: efflux RND transporter periplasmic adaptor subunit [Proteobacteria bacterium]|nr:MAG: efflux RND transporter periplasmic adaptor subunit [Pseudomonadota bacterium]